ncbi:MAG: hypothetical protein H7257_13760 [Taibaiella sp.]|nr:hypothetical protein [Taibaiella sp.]
MKKGIISERAIIKNIYGDDFDIGGGKEFSSETGANPRTRIHTIREELSKNIGIPLAELNSQNIFKYRQ